MTPVSEDQISTGARPVGHVDATPAAAAQNVQQMFDSIAGRYDLLNHLLSGGVDRFWWWRTARALRSTLAQPEARILDLCCGTGDMTLALLRRRPSTSPTAPLLAVDFSHQMLSRGDRKFNSKNVIALEADALHLPLPANNVDLISSAFGFRNLSSYEEGLAELFRFLRPGGRIAILDCNQPAGVVGLLYNLYFKRILPRVGAFLSDPGAYKYLPASVERFPVQQDVGDDSCRRFCRGVLDELHLGYRRTLSRCQTIAGFSVGLYSEQAMKRALTFVFAGSLMFVVAVLAAFASMRLAIHGREIDVPNLAGLSDADAATAFISLVWTCLLRTASIPPRSHQTMFCRSLQPLAHSSAADRRCESPNR